MRQLLMDIDQTKGVWVSKFDSLKVLKQTRARVDHLCSLCGQTIPKGEIYFREYIADKFLQSLQSNRPHPESARHYYYRPKDK
jgi:hypothetical protein